MVRLRHEKDFIQRGENLRDFVFGFNDGIITTLAIVSALSGARIESIIIIIAGFANIFADAISMSLSGYISSKSLVEVFKSAIEREKFEIKNMPKVETEEIKKIYKKMGFTGKILETIVKKITSNKRRWLNIMLREDLGFSEKTFDNPKKVAAIIFASFVIAGFIPLFPYIFLQNSPSALQISLIVSFVSIFIVGSLRSIFTKKNFVKSGIEMLVVGILAAAAAYYIGNLGAQYFLS